MPGTMQSIRSICPNKSLPRRRAEPRISRRGTGRGDEGYGFLPLTSATMLQGRPWKLVLVRTGNMGLKESKALFETHIPAITEALEICTLAEIDKQTVSVVV